MEAPTPIPLETLLAHREWVRRVVLVLVRDENLAEDLEQDLWVKAIERPPVVRGSIRGWLAAALRNAVADRFRAESSRRRREKAASRTERQRSTEDVLAEADGLKRVVNAVLDLAEPYRATVLLRYFEDLPPREIAIRQGVPVETVRTRLKRAIAMLRERFDTESHGNREAWCLALLPLVQAPQGLTPVGVASGTAVVVGGMVMAKKVILVGVGLLLLGAGAWWASPTVRHPSAQMPRETAARPAPPRPRKVVSTDPLPEPVGADADRERDLFGMVVDESGTALGGAQVQASTRPWRASGLMAPGDLGRPVEGPKGLTAGDGSFRLRLEPGATVDLRVEAAGFASIVVPDCPAGERVRVVLRPGARVAVAVRDGDGAPVPGAVVRMWRPAGARWGEEPSEPARPVFDRTEVAGADGGVVFPGLTAGPTYLSSDHPLRGSSPWDTVRVPESGESRFESILVAGRTLRGRVANALSGTPIPGARVGVGWTFRRETRTATDGTFELPCWKDAPSAELYAEAEGMATARVLPGTAESVDVALTPGDRVVGRAVDGKGEPVARAAGLVQYAPRAGGKPMELRPFAAGEDGRFEVKGIACDSAHGLVLDGGTRGRAVRCLEPHEGEAGTIDLGDVPLWARVLTGTLQEASGEPVPRRAVTLDGPRGEGGLTPFTPGTVLTVRTDDLGRFRFGGLGPGSYTLRIADGSFAAADMPVTVPPDRDPAPVVLRLPKATKGVTIRVVDASGVPVVGIPVQIIEPGVPGGGPHAKTGADGRASFPKLIDAGFSFSVNESMSMIMAGEKVDERFTSRNSWLDGRLYPLGQEIEVVIHEAAEVSGVVVDGAGAPIPGLYVQAAEEDGILRYWSTRTGDPGGEFTMRLPRGKPVLLSVSQEWNGKQSVPSRWRARADGVVAPASGLRVEAHTARADVRQEVRVLDVDGSPVQGMRVSIQCPDFRWLASDASGRVVFEGLTEGEGNLSTTTPEDIQLAEGVLLPRGIIVRPGGPAVTLQFRRGGVREGVVLDPSGQPCPGAEVRSLLVGPVFDQSAPVLTDAAGRFRVAVAPGVRLDFSAHIFRAPAQDWLGYAEGVLPGDDELVIRLKPRSAFRGR